MLRARELQCLWTTACDASCVSVAVAAPPHAELAALIRACIAGSAVFGCGASPGGALLGLEFNVTNASARLCRARQVVFGACKPTAVGARAALDVCVLSLGHGVHPYGQRPQAR